MPFRYDDHKVDLVERARAVIGLLGKDDLRLATAESLTGGLLSAALTAVPGSSDVFAGGVVAYTSAAKTSLLGVDSDQLALAGGAYTAEVAEQMAAGARRVFDTEVSIATTGVAGPGPSEGVEPGLAYIACQVGDAEVAVRAVKLKGGRNKVRARVVARALELCEAALRQAKDLPKGG
jgi:nicotinamide-nucleotide amidase